MWNGQVQVGNSRAAAFPLRPLVNLAAFQRNKRQAGDRPHLEASPVTARFYQQSKKQSDQFKTRNSCRGEFIVEIVIGKDVDHLCCGVW